MDARCKRKTVSCFEHMRARFIKGSMHDPSPQQSRRTSFNRVFQLLLLGISLVLEPSVLLLQPTFGRHIVRIRPAQLLQECGDTGDGLRPPLLRSIVTRWEVAERRSRRKQCQERRRELVGHGSGGVAGRVMWCDGGSGLTLSPRRVPAD